MQTKSDQRNHRGRNPSQPSVDQNDDISKKDVIDFKKNKGTAKRPLSVWLLMLFVLLIVLGQAINLLKGNYMFFPEVSEKARFTRIGLMLVNISGIMYVIGFFGLLKRRLYGLALSTFGLAIGWFISGASLLLVQKTIGGFVFLTVLIWFWMYRLWFGRASRAYFGRQDKEP